MRHVSRVALPVALLLVICLCIAGPLYASSERPAGAGLIGEILEYVRDYHVSGPATETLVRGAVEGLLEALGDPHTSYLSPDELAVFNESLAGEYFGVGIKLEPGKKYPGVLGTIQGSPAAEADIQPGDQVVGVQGINAAGVPLPEVVQWIRGPAGTKVRLTLSREGRGEFEVELIRSGINLPTVNSSELDVDTGYIAIDHFGEQTAAEFRECLAALTNQGKSRLVLDLRNNPGGYFQSAVDIAGYLLGPGRLVANTIERGGQRQQYNTSELSVAGSMAVAVLVDAGSVSAAEILAGALQDHGAAVLVGSRTYGKGTVQVLVPLRYDNGALKLTVAKYFTPKNRVIEGKGLDPDIPVLTPELQVVAALCHLNRLQPGQVVFDPAGLEALVGGRTVRLSQTVVRYEDKIYLPLRFLFEALGYRVEWQPADGSIVISGYGPQPFFCPSPDDLVYEHGSYYIPVKMVQQLGFAVRQEGGRILVEK